MRCLKEFKLHYYNFNIGDYRADTVHLSIIEHGIYRQLIDWYYLDEKQIPKETQVVMRRLRLGSDEYHFLENVLKDFFILTDLGYFHSRIERDIETYRTQSAKNRVNGYLGGRPSKSIGKRIKTQVVSEWLAKHNPSETQTKGNQEPITNNQEPITNIKTYATRLPKDWIVPIEYIDYCHKKRPDLDAFHIAELFKDYWSALPDKTAKKTDWLATWRNWVRNQKIEVSKFKNKSNVVTDANFESWLNTGEQNG